MLNRLRSVFTHHQFMRRGNTLLITLMTVVLVVGLVGLSSEHVSSDVKLEKLNVDRQRAQNAAESMIVILEKNLIDKATSATSSLQVDLGTGAEKWFGKFANELDQVGFDHGYRSVVNSSGNVVLDSDGNATREFKPAIKPLYFNGCAIRWRIEPVKLMAKTVTPVDDAETNFFVNSERDPSLQDKRRDAAGAKLIPDEAKHFYFRMVVETYALQNPQERYQSGVTHAPWALLPNGQPDPLAQRYLHKAQSQRVIELQDTNPCLYLIYYKSDDNTGDLEIYPTGSLDIDIGSIRTNNRMFLSAPTSGSITIGGTATESTSLDRAVNIEATEGIYRLSKVDAYDRDISVITATTTNDEGTEEGEVLLNGKELTKTNDTRSDVELTAFTVGVVNGTKSADMTYYSNSSFMEPILRAARGEVLYFYGAVLGYSRYPLHKVTGAVGTPVGSAADMLLFRRPINGGSSPYYYSDVYPFATINPDLVDTAGVDLGNRKFAETPKVDATYEPSTTVQTVNGPVTKPGALLTAEIPAITHYDDAIPSVRLLDVMGVQLMNGTIRLRKPMAATNCLKMPKIPQKGYVYDVAMPVPHYQEDYGSVIGAYKSDRNTGLLIRERGVRMGGDAPANASDHNEWMKLNYVVYLGKKLERIADTDEDKELLKLGNDNWINIDITTEFFNYSGTSAVDIRDLMLHEDEFINKREDNWQSANGTVNALTINMERVKIFLRDQIVNADKFQEGGSPKYSKYFNGKIYLERTNQYNAGALDPLAPNGYHPVNGKHADAPAAIVGNVDTGAVTNAVIGSGDWTVYPSVKAVRIDKGANIGQKIGIYSAHTCYIWGNFNTTNDIQGVSIYADSMVALSEQWRDTDAEEVITDSETKINAVIVTNNVPTDIQNAEYGGSGGVQNIFRFLEDWSGKNFSFKGSIIVSGRAKYTRSPIYGEDYHKQPILKFTYDTRLATNDGQPLSSPKSTDKKRVFGTVSQ